MNGDKRYKDIIKEIKEQTGIRDFRDGMLAAHFLCRPLSRPFSVFFIKRGIIPNQVTLLMILFGIVGSVFFAIPNIYCKIIGYLFWVLWFTMDLSDGQVARYTKKYSKYGTEMDYMAHLIDHSCMNIAIWLTFIQMNVMNPVMVSGIFIGLISLELIVRNIVSFEHYGLNNSKIRGTQVTRQVSWAKYFLSEIVLFPTFIVCLSWIIVVDYYFNVSLSFYGFMLWMALYVLIYLRYVIKTIVTLYKG